MKKILVCIVFFVSSTVFSADIRIQPNTYNGLIVIEGPIVKGDYQNFIATLMEAGSAVHTAAVFSNGGDVIEAIRIGKAIRRFSLGTQTALVQGRERYGCRPFVSSANCVCMSACVLIYSSGISRHGNFLGVHRAFLRSEVVKEMDTSEAWGVSDKANEYVEYFLKSMNVPVKIIDRMLETSSYEISLIDSSEVRKSFEGYVAGLDDVLAAKCGRSEDLSLIDDQAECERLELQKLRERSFYKIMKEEILSMGRSEIRNPKILRTLSSIKGDGLLELVGADFDAATSKLSLMGFVPAKDYDELRKNDLSKENGDQLVHFTGGLTLYLSSGRVSSVGVTLTNPIYQYYSYLFSGVYSDSSPEQVVKSVDFRGKANCENSCDFKIRYKGKYLSYNFYSGVSMISLSN